MGTRVATANHLGSVLSETSARPAPTLVDHQQLIEGLVRLKTSSVRQAFQAEGVQADTAPELTEFQRGLLAASMARAEAAVKRRASAPRRSRKTSTKRTR